jgi:O-antigen/teichoic acid export membrane protein
MFNFLNLIFHFVSGRLLGDEAYGTLAAIMGIIYVFNVPSEAIQTIMSRYATKAGEKGKIKKLFLKAIKRFFYLGLISFAVFFLVSPLLSDFLSIETPLLILVGVFLVLVFIISVNRGILQGVKRFYSLGFSFFSEGALKLALAVMFILLGFNVYGAVFGIIISGVLVFFVSLVFLKDFIKVKASGNIDTKDKYSYSIPVLISIASITIFYSIDLILAKSFFPELAGQYAVISMLGKIIFFGTMPIGKAMFPIVSERFNIKKDSKDLLKKALLITFLLSFIALAAYFLFPTFIISFLYGENFLELSSLILLPCIAMTFLAFSNILIFYNLSTDSRKIHYWLLFFVFLQFFLFIIFHSSITEFMVVNIVSSGLLFFFMLFFSFIKK